MISSIKEKKSVLNKSQFESENLLYPPARDDPAAAAACPKLCFCLGGRFTGDSGIWSEVRLEAVEWLKINHRGRGDNCRLRFQRHNKQLRGFLWFVLCLFLWLLFTFRIVFRAAGGRDREVTAAAVQAKLLCTNSNSNCHSCEDF